MKGSLGSASGFDGKGMKEYYRRSYKAARRAAQRDRQAAVRTKTPLGMVVVNPAALEDTAERDRLEMKALYQQKSGDYSY